MNLKTVLQTVFLKGNAMKIKLGLFREKITYLLFLVACFAHQCICLKAIVEWFQAYYC